MRAKIYRGRGFTLIELLIVVAIIGIIVAISVINFLNAIQRAKQKRTMADMRSVATAVESYQVEWSHYPAAAFVMPSGLTLPTGTIGSIATKVSPTYIRIVPLRDGWDSWLEYGSGNNGSDYVIRSTGRDGIAETSPTFSQTTDFNSDIIMVDGEFVQLPYGVQK